MTEVRSEDGDANGNGVVYLNDVEPDTAARVAEPSGGRQHPTTARPPAVRTFPMSTP